MYQMKEQNSIKRMKGNGYKNLPNVEFKTLVVNMLKDLSKNFNKETGIIRKIQSEMKNTITKMKNMLEGINSRLDEPRG